ncbi:hypothetical protein JOD31_001250 [Methylopila capsulata]|uniref:Flotillin C-terminal domain-containing protein n=1 Tax=Methylopila capsulata TaxID=61654 RepID=A0A9W6IRL1_9HYPH|nr:hypothetical protein [Methylopila capsulata]GLK54084.1 hypothetical protein GCM10008170_01030 [Methylopila capsulata]
MTAGCGKIKPGWGGEPIAPHRCRGWDTPRPRVAPLALAEIVKPIEKISDIRIFDTGGMLGRGDGGGSGVGMGEGLAGQLLAYNAQSPVLAELLKAAGFAAGDPVSSLIAAAAGSSPVGEAAPKPQAPADLAAETGGPATNPEPG